MSLKNTLLPIHTLLHSKGRVLDVSKPIVMGILNATPDSFYNRGRDSDTDALMRTAEQMLQEGAMILDIGGTTTKPGTPLMSAQEELQRVLPVIKMIRKRFPDVWLSIDTYNARTAGEAVAEGVDIVNDISGGTIDDNMPATVAALKVPYIAMHIQGTPETMQQNPVYNDVAAEVRDRLAAICNRCKEAGITDVIIDPGFGFGKTIAQNYELMRGMDTLRMLGKPILAGISRKSMVYQPLGTSADEALNGTTALNMAALMQGASILRVHDVREAVETVKIFETLTG